MNNAKHAGSTIRSMREHLDWKVQDLAEATKTPQRPDGYSVSYLYELETGTKSSSEAVKLCTFVLAQEVIRRNRAFQNFPRRMCAS